ncbi:FK506-binding protein 5-like [Acyrthosiphon pisum]|uniref:Uncharacterized protein n=1 Tax=Acyrthosiphon pisum TaxID=7029 RepID=A0A8R2JKU7_ACYPI|nr:FK506-binding protein 5-like [Acyrthosiphon pisum]
MDQQQISSVIDLLSDSESDEDTKNTTLKSSFGNNSKGKSNKMVEKICVPEDYKCLMGKTKDDVFVDIEDCLGAISLRTSSRSFKNILTTYNGSNCSFPADEVIIIDDDMNINEDNRTTMKSKELLSKVESKTFPSTVSSNSKSTTLQLDEKINKNDKTPWNMFGKAQNILDATKKQSLQDSVTKSRTNSNINDSSNQINIGPDVDFDESLLETLLSTLHNGLENNGELYSFNNEELDFFFGRDLLDTNETEERIDTVCVDQGDSSVSESDSTIGAFDTWAQITRVLQSSFTSKDIKDTKESKTTNQGVNHLKESFCPSEEIDDDQSSTVSVTGIPVLQAVISEVMSKIDLDCVASNKTITPHKVPITDVVEISSDEEVTVDVPKSHALSVKQIQTQEKEVKSYKLKKEEEERKHRENNERKKKEENERKIKELQEKMKIEEERKRLEKIEEEGKEMDSIAMEKRLKVFNDRLKNDLVTDENNQLAMRVVVKEETGNHDLEDIIDEINKIKNKIDENICIKNEFSECIGFNEYNPYNPYKNYGVVPPVHFKKNNEHLENDTNIEQELIESRKAPINDDFETFDLRERGIEKCMGSEGKPSKEVETNSTEVKIINRTRGLKVEEKLKESYVSKNMSTKLRPQIKSSGSSSSSASPTSLENPSIPSYEYKKQTRNTDDNSKRNITSNTLYDNKNNTDINIDPSVIVRKENLNREVIGIPRTRTRPSSFKQKIISETTSSKQDQDNGAAIIPKETVGTTTIVSTSTHPDYQTTSSKTTPKTISNKNMINDINFDKILVIPVVMLSTSQIKLHKVYHRSVNNFIKQKDIKPTHDQIQKQIVTTTQLDKQPPKKRGRKRRIDIQNEKQESYSRNKTSQNVAINNTSIKEAEHPAKRPRMSLKLCNCENDSVNK